jgi:cytochrome c oxidase assembly protein subunit 15
MIRRSVRIKAVARADTRSPMTLALPFAPATSADDRLGPVRAWLWTLAALVLLMVVVGGATRLTGSGLSITEWKPVTGALPPLSETAWLAEFEKYRRIPQYELVNRGMSLAEFKVIYWWEWGHRQLGRFIGLAWFVPFVWFVATSAVRGRLALWLFAIGLLGGFQGAIGWIMVASGLKEGMTAVAPVKLALHLSTACLIFAALVFTARRLAPRVAEPPAPATVRVAARALLALLFVQIALGALVAGSKAGLVYNTWPLMDGKLVPPASTLFFGTPWIENFVDNHALVQFNHRTLAYLLLALGLWHWLSARGHARARGAAHVAAGLTAQAAVGIVALLLVVPLWAGLLHQALAVIVLAGTVLHVERVTRPAT